MEPMDLLLFLPIAIFALINVFATVAVLRLSNSRISQRILQLAFIWLVPVLGAAVCLSFASLATRGFSIIPSAGGGAASGQEVGSYGDSGSCGDGGGGDGGGDGGGGGC